MADFNILSKNDNAAVFWGTLGSALLSAAGGQRGRSRSSLLAEGVSQLPAMLQQGQTRRQQQQILDLELEKARREKEREERWQTFADPRRRALQASGGAPTRAAAMMMNGEGPAAGPSMLANPMVSEVLPFTTADSGPKMLMDIAGRETKAPTIRDFAVGDETVTRQFDPTTRQWVDMSRAPRWQPQKPEGPSIAQQANNAEVVEARNRVTAAIQKNIRPEETARDVIRRMSTKTSDTGRDNPSYDPLIERDFRIAAQRMVGDDPGFRDFLSGLDVPAPRPKEEPPPLPVASEPEQSLTDRVLSYIGFGGGEGAAESPPREPEARPEGLSDTEIISQAEQALAQGADREAVLRRLKKWGIEPGKL